MLKHQERPSPLFSANASVIHILICLGPSFDFSKDKQILRVIVNVVEQLFLHAGVKLFHHIWTIITNVQMVLLFANCYVWDRLSFINNGRYILWVLLNSDFYLPINIFSRIHLRKFPDILQPTTIVFFFYCTAFFLLRIFNWYLNSF